MNGMTRVDLYVRVCTKDWAKRGLSLLEQEKAFKEFATGHGLKIVGRQLDG